MLIHKHKSKSTQTKILSVLCKFLHWIIKSYCKSIIKKPNFHCKFCYIWTSKLSFFFLTIFHQDNKYVSKDEFIVKNIWPVAKIFLSSFLSIKGLRWKWLCFSFKNVLIISKCPIISKYFMYCIQMCSLPKCNHNV